MDNGLYKKPTRDKKFRGKALVVDDVEVNLYVAQSLLEPYGLEIDTAVSGFAAIDKVKETDYDIIFMDCMMPEMDGRETTLKLREVGYKGAVFALTANDCDNIETPRGDVFDGFITKPIDLSRLEAVLDKVLACSAKGVAPTQAKPLKDTSQESRQQEHTGQINSGLAEVFRRDAQKAVAALRRTLANEDIRLFAAVAHAMKSALANIGKSKESAFAFELERAGNSFDRAFVLNNAERFIEMLEDIIKELAPLEGANASDCVREDRAYLKEQLILVKSACENYDDEACYAALDKLDEMRWKSETADFIKEIRGELYLHSDFDRVAEMIDALSQQGD